MVTGGLLGIHSFSNRCHLPCWHSITPRQTPFDTAHKILTNEGYIKFSDPLHTAFEPSTTYYRIENESACDVALAHENGRVMSIMLMECETTRLGDLIAIIGEPLDIVPSWTNFNLIYVVGREMVARPFTDAPLVTALTFGNRSTLVTVNLSLCETELSPETEVWSIHLDPTLQEQFDNGFYLKDELLAWRGFIPYWRYNRLQPGTINC
jgi:hypothetical protein